MALYITFGFLRKATCHPSLTSFRSDVQHRPHELNINGFLRSTARGSRQIDMKTILIEIRAAEGGADAKSLVIEQYRIYQKYMALERL